ncbi:lytic transglycosylase domain-containing protein [Hylemonella gracilis]|uniref:lytic transglycosylase domain-containing protein n=1 Tax=Hylemonella gracilis TaxID=80880 RepID=UPI000A61F32A|nr:lytic transglycosylase domain-containing protein [Hylemonella gracilis]
MKFRAILTSTVSLTLGCGLLAANQVASAQGEAAPDVPAAFLLTPPAHVSAGTVTPASSAQPAAASTPLVSAPATPNPGAAATAQTVVASAAPVASWSKSRQDVLLGDMGMAYKKLDRRRMAELLPQVRGHALEIWASYWELSARLEDAKTADIEAFLTRYAGTYLEDRLRNDWLLILGKRRDWARFETEYAKFRMHDDPEVRCHALHATYAREGSNTPAEVSEAIARQVSDLWLGQLFTPGEGCAAAARRLLQDDKLDPMVVWRRARLGFEFDQPQIAQQAVGLLNPAWAVGLNQLYAGPKRYLDENLTAFRPKTREWVTLAIVRMASNDPHAAAEELNKLRWRAQLTDEERNWIWGVIGKRAARLLSDRALEYYAQGDVAGMHSDHLLWRVRAALRANDWQQVHDAIAALSPAQMRDPTWVYWRARAVLALQMPDAEQRARALLQSIASPSHFYGQLALEELGQTITAPTEQTAPSADELQAARDNPGLQRALLAIRIGLRDEGVREWNYTIGLHVPGGMSDRELLSASALACEAQVWDRCINTSDRTRTFMNYAQRFPTPYREEVQQRAIQTGLEPAFIYGLIRQESRFIAEAQSSVGAAGLMQVMPATAHWTARRIGLRNYKPKQITDRDTNIALGSSYLQLVLEAFDGSMPMAAAAYNAGPSRARLWRGDASDPVLEAAIWIENIPFGETRDYVKKVLPNTVNYAAVLSGQPQSLKARLGYVGPQGVAKPEPVEELP